MRSATALQSTRTSRDPTEESESRKQREYIYDVGWLIADVEQVMMMMTGTGVHLWENRISGPGEGDKNNTKQHQTGTGLYTYI